MSDLLADIQLNFAFVMVVVSPLSKKRNIVQIYTIIHNITELSFWIKYNTDNNFSVSDHVMVILRLSQSQHPRPFTITLQGKWRLCVIRKLNTCKYSVSVWIYRLNMTNTSNVKYFETQCGHQNYSNECHQFRPPCCEYND